MRDQAQIWARKSQNAATASTALNVTKTQRTRTRTCCIISLWFLLILSRQIYQSTQELAINESRATSRQHFKVMNEWRFFFPTLETTAIVYNIKAWILERIQLYQSQGNNITPMRRGSILKTFFYQKFFCLVRFYFRIFMPSANERYGLTPGATVASKDMRFREPREKYSCVSAQTLTAN